MLKVDKYINNKLNHIILQFSAAVGKQRRVNIHNYFPLLQYAKTLHHKEMNM